MNDLDSKTAFVTGGGSGIGLGMAAAFLMRGMKVVIGDIRADRLERALASLEEISGDVASVTVDMTDMQS